MILLPITTDNLRQARAAARQIFPSETSDGLFLPEQAYRESIAKRDPRYCYYLAWEDKRLVGITGHYPVEVCSQMWLGWFGVLPFERQKGLGEKILHATSELLVSLGESELWLYSFDREEARPAHRLYQRVGFAPSGQGEVNGQPVFYFHSKLPLASRGPGC